jgi:hypothetical protein
MAELPAECATASQEMNAMNFATVSKDERERFKHLLLDALDEPDIREAALKRLGVSQVVYNTRGIVFTDDC